MTTNNQCNHVEAIAKDMYEIYEHYQPEAGGGWDSLDGAQKAGWRNVAELALPTIGKHALNDVKDYLGIKASGAPVWWKKALFGLAAAAVGAFSLFLLQGCGHSVDMTPGRTEVCKDGSCLVIEQGHISYSQAQPKTEVAPIVQVIPSKK